MGNDEHRGPGKIFMLCLGFAFGTLFMWTSHRGGVDPAIKFESIAGPHIRITDPDKSISDDRVMEMRMMEGIEDVLRSTRYSVVVFAKPGYDTQKIQAEVNQLLSADRTIPAAVPVQDPDAVDSGVPVE